MSAACAQINSASPLDHERLAVRRAYGRNIRGYTVPSSIEERVYPESAFGGFPRCDNVISFLSRVQALAMEAGTVLNVGCGRGAGAHDSSPYRAKLHDLRGKARRVIGIDVDPEAASNPLVDEFRLIEKSKPWPVESASVDLAIADYVLEHLEDPESFFSELNRVLKPDGVACLRTPNRWGYVSLIARLIPNRFHGRVVTKVQQRREEQDVFPTYYRCNSKSAVRRFTRALGLQGCMYTIEVTPAYLAFSPILYRIGAVVHSMLPPPLRSTLLIFLRKPAQGLPSAGR